jgi:hypothetical protein
MESEALSQKLASRFGAGGIAQQAARQVWALLPGKQQSYDYRALFN